jgi:alkylhydroperoxidase/carboxymuconolactone decarboxylase family protein YurZ
MADAKSVKDYQTALDLVKRLNESESERSKTQLLISERQKVINELLSNAATLGDDQKKYLQDLVNEQNKAIANERSINEELLKQQKSRQLVVSLAKDLGNAIKEGWKYLQESDKTIKNTILNLGMSGAKAEAMRAAFEKSAVFAARIGGSLADLQTIQQGYADETGRARALTASMLEDITLIGKGTGLGIEQATKLGAQFEFMGADAKSAMDYTQGIVDTSERMGVNTTKVLKNIIDNFKKVNTFSFVSGVKGIAKMAENAEKLQVSVESALNSATIAKSLEGAIDMFAQLQVMGGNFAKTDPFQAFYLARNEPEKWQEEISKMTKGIVTFKKNSEGVFEKFISPADRQRLEQAGKALGRSAEEMTVIAQRRAELDLSERQMAGKGLTAKQKEWITGAMVLNSKTNQLQVSLGGTMHDIGALTSDQANSFIQERKTLEERAKQAMTFDETFKATIEILKASLLPLLTTINKIMSVTIKPLADLATKGFGGAITAGGILLAAAGVWKGISFLLGRAADKLVSGAAKRFGGGGGGLGGVLGKGAGKEGEAVAESLGKKGLSGLAEQRQGIGAGAAMAGKGKMFAGAGAGIGAAALGVGAGIGAAAAGISLLATAMAKLTPEQAKTLGSIVKSIAWVVGIGAAAAGAIMIFGGASTAAAPGLLAFGGAIALVGVGIGAAAAGIGLMGTGLSKLSLSVKGSGKDMLELGGGIAAMAAGMALFTVGGLGLIAFSATLNRIAKNSEAIGQVGEAFKEINAVMHGSKEDFLAVENAVNAISTMNTKGGSAFAQLASLLKTPLKVEFADKNVQLANDITLNIDGQRFMQKIFKANTAITHQEELRTQSVNQ